MELEQDQIIMLEFGPMLFISLFYIVICYINCANRHYKFNLIKFIIFRLFIMFVIIELSILSSPFLGLTIDFFLMFSFAMSPSLCILLAKLLKFKKIETLNTDTINDADFLKCKKCNRIISSYDRVCPGCLEKTDNYDIEGYCKNCNTKVDNAEKTCIKCGADLSDPSSIIPMNPIPSSNNQINQSLNNPNLNVSASNNTVAVDYAKITDYNPLFSKLNSDNALLEYYIDKELSKLDSSNNGNQLPKRVHIRQIVLNLLFVILLFIFNVLLFFHFDFYIYLFLFVLLIVLFVLRSKFNLKKYFIKELKSRPNEKISNVILSTKNDFVTNRSFLVLFIGIIVAMIIPLIYFKEPRIFYEKSDDGTGYVIRFYTLGISGNEVINIPNTYNGKPIVGIRGNVFKNMPVKEVNLPDSIWEIRGSAFENDSNLVKINIPKNLTYLGGSAFKNCTSLEKIELPESLTYIGGEAFYGDSSLKTINIPSGITEIRGDTFYNCSSLSHINIPDGVTRIGGHAFQKCTSLSNIEISENSRLNEIGSSAFRECYSLYEINLPRKTYVNERAFKNSPTIIKYFGENVNNASGEISNNNNNIVEKTIESDSNYVVIYLK